MSGASSTGSYLTRGKGCFFYDNTKYGGNGLGGFGDWNSYYYHVFNANVNNNNWGNPMAGHANAEEVKPFNINLLPLISY